MHDENAHVMMTPMRQGVTPGKTMQMQSGAVGVGTTAGKNVMPTTTTQKRRALGNISNTAAVLRSAGGGGAQAPLGRTAMKAERARTERSGSRLAKGAVAQPTSRAAVYAETPVERPCGLMRDELQREMDARHERDMRRRVARMTSRTAGMTSSSSPAINTCNDAENGNGGDGDEAVHQYHLLYARDAGNEDHPDDLQDLADALVTAGADTLP